MDKNIQKIIDLVNASIKEEVFNQSIDSKDYQLIKDNQLIGLVYHSINKDMVNQDLIKKLKSDYYQYIRKDEIQIQLIEELKVIFNKNNIDFVFLKGSFLKHIYPESYMRAMGDIDVLVKNQSMTNIHSLLKNHGFINWSNSYAHDCFMKHKINVEIHPLLDSNIEGEYQDLFKNPWQYTMHLNGNEYLLSHEYNFFYQIYHMIKHLYRSGVGYRSLVDLFLFLNHYGIEMNKDTYQMIYNQFPKHKFVDYTIGLINKLFPDFLLKDYFISDKIQVKNHEPFIQYLFYSGTHGLGETHNLFIGDMAKKHHKNKFIFLTKIEFLIKKTFLGLNQMKPNYSYLHKYPFLLPLAWIQRLIKLAFSKKSRSKLKRLQLNKEDIVKVEDLFNQIGI